jgi:hypothetical protein
MSESRDLEFIREMPEIETESYSESIDRIYNANV